MREDRSVEILEEQVKSLQKQLEKIQSERDEAYTAITDLSAERDTLQAAVGGDQDKLTAAEQRVQALETAARERTHKDKFRELVKGQGVVSDKAVEHLWTISGYKAEDDEPSEKELSKLVAKLKTEADYAFKSEATDEEKKAAETRKSTVSSRTKYGLNIRDDIEPPGSGRADRNKGGDGTIITREMRADPRFMLDPANKKLIADAAREGRFRD